MCIPKIHKHVFLYCSPSDITAPSNSVFPSSAESERPVGTEEYDSLQSKDFDCFQAFEKNDINKDSKRVFKNQEISSTLKKIVKVESTNTLVINATKSSPFINSKLSEILPSPISSTEFWFEGRKMNYLDMDPTITESTCKFKGSSLMKLEIAKVGSEKETDQFENDSTKKIMYAAERSGKISTEVKMEENELASKLVITVSQSLQFAEIVTTLPEEDVESSIPNKEERYLKMKNTRKKKSKVHASFQLEDYNKILELWGVRPENPEVKFFQESLEEDMEDYDDEKCEDDISSFQKGNVDTYAVSSQVNDSKPEMKNSDLDLSNSSKINDDKLKYLVDERNLKLKKYYPLMEIIEKKNPEFNAPLRLPKYPVAPNLRRRRVDRRNMNVSDETTSQEIDDKKEHPQKNPLK